MNMVINDLPWVIINLLDEQFAVSASQVREMVVIPKTVQIPKAPDYIRGVINFRGKVIPVMDLRMRMESLADESENFIQLLNQRGEDHEKGVDPYLSFFSFSNGRKNAFYFYFVTTPEIELSTIKVC